VSDLVSMQGRVALVTGAGSPEGIGLAAARIIGSRGGQVAIASTTERIDRRAAELTAEGIDAAGFVADLTDSGQAARLVGGVLARFGRIDALVNNAGIAAVGEPALSTPFVEQDEAGWDRDIAVNLKTAYNVTRNVLPGMVERGYGRVVNVSSVSGPMVVYPHGHGYAAAKAGLDGLTRALAHDHGRHGVTVNSVAPGWISTGSSSQEEIVGGAHTPIGRPGSAAEVGELIAWLASEASSYVTGQSIVVDGGNTIQEMKVSLDAP
jgi:3-oxoacyl-[acyl-carrier protein] reductase